MAKPKRIELTLPEPPSVNRIWRTGKGRNYLSQEARDFKLAAQVAAAKQGYLTGGAFPFPAGVPIRVTLTWYRNRRAGDLDNRAKATLDCLNRVLWADDSQVVELHCFRQDAPKRGRVELLVEAVS